VARLHEYQGKALLAARGIAVPRGGVARSSHEARVQAERLGGPTVVKIQAWLTGRAAIGGVKFATDPAQAEAVAQSMLGMKAGNFAVSEVLVEERLEINRELFVSLSIDDAARAPVLLLGLEGGSGIEDRAEAVTRIAAHPVDGIDRDALRDRLERSTLPRELIDEVERAIHAVFRTARECEARSVEVNPLVITKDGRVMAADCRVTIDDYAVFRHPELGIEIARELDHPPTALERIAYAVEQADHRGTFYFAELPRSGKPDERLIGFHGAGGGGSMMSMDAVVREGFTPANFCDTSGNPSAAKVYAAARIILAQPGIIGYFGSGSGVASQEQYWSAYGLAKAFIEMGLNIPAVIRLGGNSEDRAVEILETACRKLPAKVEGYRKDDTPASVASRFRALVEARKRDVPKMSRHVPTFVGKASSWSLAIERGRVWIDLSACDSGATALIMRNSLGLFAESKGRPVLAVSEAEAKDKDSEFIALEVECARAGRPIVFVDMPLKGLDT